MPILGSHMSIAGGYYKAVERGQECSCDCVQIFTKNNNQWKAKPITDEDAQQFQTRLSELNICHPLSHSSYLINLAAPDDSLWKKSIDALVIELQRADQLAIPFVVVHPGSFTSSSEDAGLRRIIAAIDEVHAQTVDVVSQILLENTAGQGTNLGWRFEQLAVMIGGVKNSGRLGVCFDTCHAFAAGYPLKTKKEYNATMNELDEAIGLSFVKAFHLNDSKRELGSRVDRHEHIGHGQLGLDPFRYLLADRRFRQTPMYLETAKGENDVDEDWDVVNLRTLRSLIR